MQPYMAEWRERGLDVVLITADRPDRLQDFIAEHGLELYALLDGKRTAVKLYRVQSIPVSIYLDRNGIVRHSAVGWGPTSLDGTVRLAEMLIEETPK